MELQVLDQNVIVQAFQTQGGTDELGKQILQAIHKGEVPHVSIKF